MEQDPKWHRRDFRHRRSPGTRHQLLDELKKLHKFLNPGETLLVADSATGQQAVSVAQTFDQEIGITGLILTKLDGDARGGAALSMRAVTGRPIKYIGEGEKIDDLAEFHPNRMADRILGMGDVVSMVEQVADKIDEKEAMKSAKRLQSGKFDFNDFLDQMKMIQNLGPLEGLLGMLPGFSKIKKQLPTGALSDGRIKQMEAIVLSMTKKERAKPIIIKAPRRKRIANGSGTTLLQVNQLLKQFGQMQKMMKSKGKMKDMMKQLGGMGGGGGMEGLMGGGGGMPDMKAWTASKTSSAAEKAKALRCPFKVDGSSSFHHFAGITESSTFRLLWKYSCSFSLAHLTLLQNLSLWKRLPHKLRTSSSISPCNSSKTPSSPSFGLETQAKTR